MNSAKSKSISKPINPSDKVVNPEIAAPQKVYFSGPYFRQKWSITDSIIFYAAKNPSTPEVYQKLIKTCKYFFIKNSIIVVSELAYFGYDWHLYFGNKNLRLINVPIKLWCTDRIKVVPVDPGTETLISSIIPKIYQINIKRVEFRNQNLSYNEFLYIASKATVLHFAMVNIINGDGAIVPLEKLVEACSKISSISFYAQAALPPSFITSETFKELLKIHHFSKIDEIRLHSVPECFDLETFYIYMKQNKVTDFELHFCDSISDAYEKRLEAIVDEILEFQYPHFKFPVIDFPGIDWTKYVRLWKIQW